MAKIRIVLILMGWDLLGFLLGGVSVNAGNDSDRGTNSKPISSMS